MSKFLKIIVTAVASMSAFAAVAQSATTWSTNKTKYVTSATKAGTWNLSAGSSPYRVSVWKGNIERCTISSGCTLAATRSEAKTTTYTTAYTSGVSATYGGATVKAEIQKSVSYGVTLAAITSQTIKVGATTEYQFQTFVRRQASASNVRGFYEPTGKTRDVCNMDCSALYTEWEHKWNSGIAYTQKGDQLRDGGAVVGEWVRIR